jgi:uncharacterized protein
MATQTIESPRRQPAADVDACFPGRYLSVTSFRRDGAGVATPLWFVSDGERLFALTDAHAAKVRRIRHNPRVLVAPCRASGKLRGEPLPAHAEVLTDTADLDRVQQLLIERYKISYRLVMSIYRLRRRLGGGGTSATDGAALVMSVD